MKRKPGRPRRNLEEERMLDALDRSERLKDFELKILPTLQVDLKNGMSADDIYRKYEHFAAARAISIVATEPDSSAAMTAVRDILDRSKGKAVERKQLTHKLERLSDEELDALITTKLTEIESEKSEDEEKVDGD